MTKCFRIKSGRGRLKRELMTCVGVSFLVASSPEVQAREYYYFHKTGIAKEQFSADRAECERLSGGIHRRGSRTIYVPQYNNLSAGQNAAAVAIASLFAGMISGGQDRKTMSIVERTCMADKGYDRYRVDRTVVQNIEKLPTQEERLERHFAMAATSDPVGEEVVE